MLKLGKQICKMPVIPIPSLSDNYAYLIYDSSTKRGCVVDPVDPDKVVQIANQNQVEITSILTTHHHWYIN